MKLVSSSKRALQRTSSEWPSSLARLGRITRPSSIYISSRTGNPLPRVMACSPASPDRYANWLRQRTDLHSYRLAKLFMRLAFHTYMTSNCAAVYACAFFCEAHCVSPGAHRMPFLWSKAGIIEAGCSDMRATRSCSTSWMFSSCGGRT